MTPASTFAGLGPICDAGIHIYDQSRPIAPTATIAPPHAPLDAYRTMQRALGLSRVVVSQPTAYAFDNTLVLETLGQIGPSARGIVVVPADIDEKILESMHDNGVRSVRFVMFPGGVLGWDSVEPIARKVASMNWALKFQLPGDRFDEYAPLLDELPTGSIIDVNASTFGSHISLAHPAFVALRALLATGRCWISFCAPYYSSGERDPDTDMAFTTLARQLLEDNPQRCIWASHWPYLGFAPPPAQHVGFDWLNRLTSKRHELAAILVDNPAKLFGF